MDDTLRRQTVTEAKEHWDANRGLETGRILYERIPRELRAEWAASVLQFAYSRISTIPEVDMVLEFAQKPDKWREPATDPHKWRRAHGVFDAVRSIRIRKTNLGAEEQLKDTVLALAENVAKVVYNAYGYPAPFDHNAGWKIAENFKSIVEQIGTSRFASEAWSVLCHETYLQLDSPVMCHPGCATCYVIEWLKSRKNAG